MQADLEALAGRCEAASGPSPELDALIFRAIGAPMPLSSPRLFCSKGCYDAANPVARPEGD